MNNLRAYSNHTFSEQWPQNISITDYRRKSHKCNVSELYFHFIHYLTTLHYIYLISCLFFKSNTNIFQKFLHTDLFINLVHCMKEMPHWQTTKSEIRTQLGGLWKWWVFSPLCALCFRVCNLNLETQMTQTWQSCFVSPLLLIFLFGY